MSGLDALVAEGEALLARERRLCREGRLDAAEALAAEKAVFVERLAAMTPRTAGPGAGAALARLVAAARANERLIEAARRGLRAARRRLAEAGRLGRGAVAYRADGAAIVSREDAAGRTRRA